MKKRGEEIPHRFWFLSVLAGEYERAEILITLP